jgi:hypothetical protein
MSNGRRNPTRPPKSCNGLPLRRWMGLSVYADCCINHIRESKDKLLGFIHYRNSRNSDLGRALMLVKVPRIFQGNHWVVKWKKSFRKITS